MSKIDPNKFGGPYDVISSEAELRERAAARRRSDRFVYEQIIADGDDEKAVERAKEKLAALDAKEGR